MAEASPPGAVLAAASLLGWLTTGSLPITLLPLLILACAKKLEDPPPAATAGGSVADRSDPGEPAGQFGRRASEANEADESLFRAVLEAAPQAMLILEQSGAIGFANLEAGRLFGYDARDLVGRPIDILVPATQEQTPVTHHDAFVQRTQARIADSAREVIARHRDGRAISVEMGFSVVRRGDGIAVVATVTDLTQRRRVEEELRLTADELKRSNHELEAFAYVASHDLQEPLRMVASYTQLLRRRYGDRLDRDAHDFMDYAVDGAMRMQTLIQALLMYSRVGRGVPNRSEVDANRVAEVAVANLRAVIEESGATVTIDPLPAVYVDADRLLQIFQNLIGNAIKFRSASAPHVQVGTRPVEAGVALFVQDDGIGIDPRFTDRIFQVFQRLHSHSEFPGSGIGLAVCKRIVEQHGGTIWVEAAPVRGSTFVFTLPPAPAV